MNIYFWIILSALAAGFILELVADYLNVKNISGALPKEFKDVFSDEDYGKSQVYLKERTKFGLISSTFGLAALLVFWLAGGFPFVDSLARSISDFEIIRGLIFIGILLAANWIITLPFGLYSTFVIEEKYGFNKTTAKTYALDLLKSLALTGLLGAPIFGLILFILGSFGEEAWIYGWVFASLISIVVGWLAPTVIMPIFNKFEPLEEGELRNKIFKMADKAEFPLKNVFVMDGSKRSTKSNAFFTGFGRNKRIALFDTLIEKRTDEEIVAVLAHEIGHYKKKHILVGMIIGILHLGVLFFLLSVFLYEPKLYEAFFMVSTPIYAGLVFFGALYSPVETVLSIAMNAVSRKNERQADRFAAELLADPEYLSSALKNLSADNLSNLRPHPFYVILNYSHPPVLERIRYLNDYSK